MPALLRLAHQMVGDPGVDTDVVARVVSRPRMRRAIAGADDVVVVAALVRSALRAGSFNHEDGSPLAALNSRERVAVVLAFAAGWDASGVAEAMRTRPRRVHAHVQRALQLASEPEWRGIPPGGRWDVAAGANVDGRTAAAGHRRRERQATLSLATAVALTMLTGAAVATVRVVT